MYAYHPEWNKEVGQLAARAVGTLREGGCGEVVVVAGPQDETGRRVREQAEALGARVAVNGRADSEQADSLRAGLLATLGIPQSWVLATPS